jgi:biopolymer transport protein ExbB
MVGIQTKTLNKMTKMPIRITRPNGHFLKSLVCFLLMVGTMSCTSHAWWNAEWTLRKKITIDTTDKGLAISDDIGTTPVLIRLHDGDFRFASAKDDASDIRFVAADDKTLLPYHIEKFDSLMSEAFVWVKVPDVKPGGQVSIWLYYGNTAGKADKAEDAKGTYDKDTALVYHFEEHGPAADSTGNANNALNAGTPADGSMIGGGLRLTGHSLLTIPATPSLAWIDGGSMTWSAWVKPGVLQPSAVIFSRREGSNGLIIGIDNGAPYVEVVSGGNTQRSVAGAPVAAASWHHLAVVADGSKITVYLDGISYATLAVPLPALNSPAFVGGDGVAGADPAAAPSVAPGTTSFSGEMDELEMAKVARPAGFIKLAAVGQGPDGAAKLVVMGQDEEMTNWLSALSTGTFGVLIKSLTPDGWAVIAILSVMAVVSWSVMFNKAKLLNVIKKGNGIFMKEWVHLAADLTFLDNPDENSLKTLGGRVDSKGVKAMRNATIYRIYHIGAEEIRHRIHGEGSAGAKVLSAQSIQAIRASLDGGLVRETQKLNNLMVLLTIAISGGPFLGLLGTVVGVMITFAAIAQAGDVNVNAIAPGIAAALLATVAGLAVAIPSLFGYNYLTIQIKDVISDMHVFVDEFVTKMAEFYRPPSDTY